MSENSERKKKKYPFGSDWFRDIDRVFEEMKKNIFEQLRDVSKEHGKAEGSLEVRPIYGPNAKGVAIRGYYVGKSNTPKKLPPAKFNKEQAQELEPLIDVHESDQGIIVTAEVPAAREEEIDVAVTEESVEIRARHYLKRVSLPAKVDRARAQMFFKNNVVEVKIPKLQPKLDSGIRI